MSIEKAHLGGHTGYVAHNEEKKQGVFAWWNARFSKVVLYETYRRKDNIDRFAYGKRKSKAGACQKNINFIPELTVPVMYISGKVAGVITCSEEEFETMIGNLNKVSQVSQPTSDESQVEPVSADHDIKKTIKDIGV